MAATKFAQTGEKVNSASAPSIFPSDVLRTLRSMAPVGATHAVIIWGNDNEYPIQEIEAFADLYGPAENHSTICLDHRTTQWEIIQK